MDDGAREEAEAEMSSFWPSLRAQIYEVTDDGEVA